MDHYKNISLIEEVARRVAASSTFRDQLVTAVPELAEKTTADAVDQLMALGAAQHRETMLERLDTAGELTEDIEIIINGRDYE